jgi:hypothetical protein
MTLHPRLSAGRWHELSLVEQLANVGSEVGRAARARAIGNDRRLGPAMDRALELFDLTLADPRWRHRLKEIARAREVVCDYLVGENVYRSTPESLEAYFLPFALAARSSARPVPERSESLGEARPAGLRPRLRSPRPRPR